MTSGEPLAFDLRDDFATCRYHGPFDASSLIAAARQVSAYCALHEVTRILIDIRGSLGDLTVEDRYVVANNMSYDFLPTVRIAIWGRQDQTLADKTWTRALVAHGYSARTFREEVAAVRWLLSDDPAG